MNIDAFEKREQMLKLREKVLQAEQERLNKEETLSVSEARKKLKERIHGLKSRNSSDGMGRPEKN